MVKLRVLCTIPSTTTFHPSVLNFAAAAATPSLSW